MSEKKEHEKNPPAGGENKEEQKQEDSQKKIEELEKQKAEYLSGWQRERADFLNYKKEEMERIGELLKYAGEEMVVVVKFGKPYMSTR